MTKTLHITNAYHESSGGIRTFYQALLRAAAQARRQVRLVVPGADTRVEDLDEWARIHYIKAPRSLLIDRRYRLLLPHRYLFGRRSRLWQILETERPDLIEICDKYALVYLGGLIRQRWLPGEQRPALAALTCERMDDNVQTFLSGWPVWQHFARWYMRTVYMPQFDAHLAVSEYTAQELDSTQRPVTVAPMGLETRAFAAASASREARLAAFGDIARAPNACILLYVGRLSREKGLPLLVDMMSALAGDPFRTFHLVLLGEGPLRPWLQARAAALVPGRVHLPGHVVDRQALALRYANADLLVHPNAREPYGLVPLEAMASGLPVVLPRAGGVLTYATDDNAWLAEPTVDGFVSTVKRALLHDAQRYWRRARARDTAAACDWSRVTERYFRLYDRIVAHSAATRPITQAGWRAAHTL